MNKSEKYFVFSLDEQSYALHLFFVERVVRIVEITPLPQAPEAVLGIINVQGLIVPVFNIRRRFHLPERETGLNDQLIIAHTSQRPVALVVDEAVGIVERSENDVVESEKVLPGMEYVEGVAKFNDGMLLIHDLDKFLSLPEKEALARSLSEAVEEQP